MHFIDIITFSVLFVLTISALPDPPDEVEETEIQSNPSHDKYVFCPTLTKNAEAVAKNALNNENVDFNLCTHLISFDSYALKQMAPWEGSLPLKDDYEQMTQFRNKFKHLNVLLGVQIPIKEFIKASDTSELHQKFVYASEEMVSKFGFDGMHMIVYDLENGSPEAFDKIITLLRALKEKFKRSDLLLTATIQVSKDILKKKFDFATLSKAFDFISFAHMYAEISSPEFTFKTASIHRSSKTVKENLKKLIESGVPASKVIMYLHLGGPKFVQDSSKKNLDNYHSQLKYNDICDNLSDPTKWEITYVDDIEMCARLDETEGIVYENSRAFANKVRYGIREGFAGVITGVINDDDFLGKCKENNDTFEDYKPIQGVTLNIPERSGITFPMIRTINEAIEVTLDEIRQENALKRSEPKPVPKPEPEPGKPDEPNEPSKPDDSAASNFENNVQILFATIVTLIISRSL